MILCEIMSLAFHLSCTGHIDYQVRSYSYGILTGIVITSTDGWPHKFTLKHPMPLYQHFLVHLWRASRKRVWPCKTTLKHQQTFYYQSIYKLFSFLTLDSIPQHSTLTQYLQYSTQSSLMSDSFSLCFQVIKTREEMSLACETTCAGQVRYTFRYIVDIIQCIGCSLEWLKGQ